ncbi:hypothetical protein LWM68_09610 [Niabella sp. W65]|nr:hypothetical protein [Niabella sp. W65]MCH7363002.1 hypothetical protein [Niabella sp. W65]ULT38939.1 hypothetical protein KRR40_28280 [Niabella sp. I65]
MGSIAGHLQASLLQSAEFYADGCRSNKKDTIKNPLTNISPMQLAWACDDPRAIKFYTAIAAFQNKYEAGNVKGEMEALKQVVANPLKLETYYHDKDIAETISAKSLRRVVLNILKPEIKLTVLKNSPSTR